MNNSGKYFLSAFTPSFSGRPPFWLMRQAGRYLPEYKELRKKAKNFLDFCYTPDKACEVTLQPIRRFNMDAAIIFSDILVIPHALGADVRFEEGKGPILKPVQNSKDLELLSRQNFASHLSPVYEALRLTRKALPAETTLIGFAGAPWTLACYMIEGKGSRDFQLPRTMIYKDPAFFIKLVDMLTDAVSSHAIAQIEAGAEVIQIFDSWAGVLSEKQFSDWSIVPTKKIVSAIKKAYPSIPVIGFPRMSGSKITDYVKQTGVDAVSIDGSVTLSWAKEHLQPHTVVQGNLDQLLLAYDKNAMLEEAKRILSIFGDKRFIFNLGHGVIPETPPDNVLALSELIRSYA
jgi:uroporphyrinogen decarboxylase